MFNQCCEFRDDICRLKISPTQLGRGLFKCFLQLPSNVLSMMCTQDLIPIGPRYYFFLQTCCKRWCKGVLPLCLAVVQDSSFKNSCFIYANQPKNMQKIKSCNTFFVCIDVNNQSCEFCADIYKLNFSPILAYIGGGGPSSNASCSFRAPYFPGCPPRFCSQQVLDMIFVEQPFTAAGSVFWPKWPFAPQVPGATCHPGM